MDKRHRFCMQEIAIKPEAAVDAQRRRVAQEASEELRRREIASYAWSRGSE